MPDIIVRIARLCRMVAAMLIAGVLRRRDDSEVEARLATRPVPEQALITGLVLVALFLCALIAAQFGIWGMLVFALLVVILAR